jgi:hypothetical protein
VKKSNFPSNFLQKKNNYFLCPTSTGWKVKKNKKIKKKGTFFFTFPIRLREKGGLLWDILSILKRDWLYLCSHRFRFLGYHKAKHLQFKENIIHLLLQYNTFFTDIKRINLNKLFYIVKNLFFEFVFFPRF